MCSPPLDMSVLQSESLSWPLSPSQPPSQPPSQSSPHSPPPPSPPSPPWWGPWWCQLAAAATELCIGAADVAAAPAAGATARASAAAAKHVPPALMILSMRTSKRYRRGRPDAGPSSACGRLRAYPEYLKKAGRPETGYIRHGFRSTADDHRANGTPAPGPNRHLSSRSDDPRLPGRLIVSPRADASNRHVCSAFAAAQAPRSHRHPGRPDRRRRLVGRGPLLRWKPRRRRPDCRAVACQHPDRDVG